jgi:DNA polymerase elongation subunit (family B)
MEKIVDEFAVPVFTCQGKKLTLTDIVRDQKVIAVTIKYQGRQKEAITKRIADFGGIEIIYSDTDIIIIRISNKKTFQEIDEDCSENSIYTKYTSFIRRPYQLNLPIEGLIGVEWL